MRKVAPLIILSALIMSCGLPGKFKKLDIETIEFGSGGGFTGIFKNYSIDVKQQTISSKGKVLGNISKDDLKTIYDHIKGSDINKQVMNKPGNMSYYINFYGKEGNNKITWGDSGFDTPKEVVALYRSLINTVKNSRQ